MPSIEVIDSWSLQEIRSEIERLLPPEHTFHMVLEEGFWIASVRHGDEVIWTDQAADPRLVSLGAFGWLFTRGKKTQHPAWRAKRGAEPARPAHRPAPGVAPNPPDLEPDELINIFGKNPKK